MALLKKVYQIVIQNFSSLNKSQKTTKGFLIPSLFRKFAKIF